MSTTRIPIVRNTIGVYSRFSVSRFAADAVLRGDDRRSAIASARRLLRDLRRAGVLVVTTDDIRHWILEQDPLVFQHRRHIRETDFTGRSRYRDSLLARIADLAGIVDALNGALLTELFLDYFVPGAGNAVFLRRDDGDEEEKEKVTPLPDVELRWGDIVDQIMPRDADYTRFGSAGSVTAPDPADPRQTFFLFIGGDDTVSTLAWPRPPGPVQCDKPLLVYVSYYRNAPGCAGVNFRSVVRGALLYAVEEAFRQCRTSPCTDAMTRFLYAVWGCAWTWPSRPSSSRSSASRRDGNTAPPPEPYRRPPPARPGPPGNALHPGLVRSRSVDRWHLRTRQPHVHRELAAVVDLVAQHQPRDPRLRHIAQLLRARVERHSRMEGFLRRLRKLLAQRRHARFERRHHIAPLLRRGRQLWRQRQLVAQSEGDDIQLDGEAECQLPRIPQDRRRLQLARRCRIGPQQLQRRRRFLLERVRELLERAHRPDCILRRCHVLSS